MLLVLLFLMLCYGRTRYHREQFHKVVVVVLPDFWFDSKKDEEI